MSLTSPFKLSRKFAVFALSIAALISLAACGGAGGSSSGGPPPPPPPPPPPVQPAKFLYVSEPGGFTRNGQIPTGITGFTVDASTGTLTPISGSPFAAPSGPLATTPDGKFLYLANLSIDQDGIDRSTIVEFAIGGDGKLTQIGSVRTAAPGQLQVAPSGKFLYVATGAGQNKSRVVGYQIDSSGALIPLPQAPDPFSAAAFRMAITPSGKFLYAMALANLSPCVSLCEQILLVAYALDQNTGALTTVAGSPFAATAPFAQKECDCPDLQRIDLAMDGQSRFLYLPNTIANNIIGFAMDGTTGALSALPGSPFESLPSLSGAVSPDGKFLFAADGEKMAAFSIQSSGALTPVPGSPFPSFALQAERVNNSQAVDPSGHFLYVQNIGFPGSISGFSIGADGSLTAIPGSPFQTPEMQGDGPGPFVIVP